MTNKIPGGSETQKMLRQAASLNTLHLCGLDTVIAVHATAEDASTL